MKNSIFVDFIKIASEKLEEEYAHSVYYGDIMDKEQKERFKRELNQQIDKWMTKK